MLIALLACIFLFTVLVLNLIKTWATRKQSLVETRLKKTVAHASGDETVFIPVSRLDRIRRLGQILSWPASGLSKGFLTKLQRNLIKAGLPLKAEELVGISLICGIVGSGLGLILFQRLAFGLLAGLFGLFLPVVWVNLQKQRRIAKIEAQLLDCLVLLANSLRAGHSFMQALELVGKEAPQPIASEFTRVNREAKLGVSVEEALLNLQERVESKDLDLVVTGVLIQRQVGGNLAEVLDGIATTIDKRIKTKAKIKALTAQGRMSAWIVSLLPFALAAFIFGSHPDFGKIMLQETLGIAMLFGGGIMLILGVLVIRKVVNIDA